MRPAHKLSAWGLLLLAAGSVSAQTADLSVWPPGPSGQETLYSPPGAVSAAGVVATQQFAEPLDQSLSLSYSSESVYRGINRTSSDATGNGSQGSNWQFEGRSTLAPGSIRPFVDAFASFNDADEESSLQEARLSGGAEWHLDGVTLSAGGTTYAYPSRTGRNTNELFACLELNDAHFWGAQAPVFSPHLLVAWDSDANDGGYAEMGIEHQWRTPVPELFLTASAAVAYTEHLRESFVEDAPGAGWQHAQLGLEARYQLNALLNVPRAQGEWSLAGFVYHSQHLARVTLGENVTWGGCRLQWRR